MHQFEAGQSFHTRDLFYVTVATGNFALPEEGILRMQTGFESGFFSHADSEERCIMVVFPTQRTRVSLELFTFWT